jgi:uncharacterized protein YndB with AHSA1/START domain
MTDPVRKSITVPLPPSEAFDLFTDGIDGWWPKDTHSIGAGTGNGDKSAVTIEPHEGGAISETLPDGSTATWGKVTEWQPGSRFSATWHVGRPEEEATFIDVTFSPSDAGTRVDLTHSGWEVLGDQAVEMCANYNNGWDHVLGRCFGNACLKRAA